MSDIDDDGRADLIWRQTQTGDLAAWLMDGSGVKQSSIMAFPLTGKSRCYVISTVTE